MPISQGVSKQIRIKKETTWGVLPGATGARVLRRVKGNFNLKKESYESDEIRTDFQTADMRHGSRSVEGSLSAELSPGSYADLMGSVLAKDFVTGATAASLSVTIAASGSNFTITRATGSWLTDGFFVGNVVRLTGAGLNVANVSNNALILSMTALALTVRVLSSTPMVAEGPIASVTATVAGKHSFAPLTGHTNDSYTVEEWYSDISESEVSTGLKVGSVDIKVPTTGLVTADFAFMGKDLLQTGSSAYFTSPSSPSTTGIFSSASGAVVVNGTPVALITDIDIKIERNQEAASVVGADTASDIFVGRIGVSGSFGAYFDSGAMRDYFKNESVVTLSLALVTGSAKNADVVTITLPAVKINSADKEDAELGTMGQYEFKALLNSVTTAGLVGSTILIQDSAA